MSRKLRIDISPLKAEQLALYMQIVPVARGLVSRQRTDHERDIAPRPSHGPLSVDGRGVWLMDNLGVLDMPESHAIKSYHWRPCELRPSVKTTMSCT
jgi:hypothetical protein